MVIIKVTRNFQITLPDEIRKKLGIKEGDYVEIKEENGKISIVKLPKERKSVKFGKTLTIEEINKTIEKSLIRL